MRKLIEKYRRYYNMEEWRDIKRYEGYYQVSNTGKVKSLERTVRSGRGYRIIPEKILEGYPDKDGYLYVQLWKNCICKNCRINRLVAMAFIPNPDNLPEVNHKDENKQNNYVENLEWCTTKYNCNYGTRNKRRAEKLKGRKMSEESIKKRVEKTNKPVIGINKVSGLILEFPSITEAGRVLCIDISTISKCCRGKGYKSAGGYYWHYASDSEEVANEQE